MMRPLIDKKIFFYILIFLFFGSLHSQNFNSKKIFNIKDINISGLNYDMIYSTSKELNNLKNKNIVEIDKDAIVSILNKNPLIDDFFIFKKYPSTLEISVYPTTFLANINIDGKNHYIGSNKKFIESQKVDNNIPIIFGKPSIDDFFYIKKNILNNDLDLKEISKLYFFPSKRWDIEFKNENLLKLPLNNIDKAISDYLKIYNSENFKNIKMFDMRIENRLILNEL